MRGRGILDDLCERVGDDLRSVVVYTASDYDLQYVRDDVAADYDEHAIERAVEEMRFKSLEADYIEDVFRERHGDHRCTVTYFADAVELHFPVSATTGLSVAVDAAYFARQDSFIEFVIDHLDDAV
ncbi:hypothetical protein J2752_001853 [Halarchaeum rubridurum]|uniref:Uncharacterized protein n=1 Tax=Halarchaeum rubridurum TaxID=489911 RepID=A0A830G199_9EURY|nr:hypothetical protein [Halarchaeum rubridurum]MBP1954941.1 hypothetical protein [Halarchaeum rubridurum]GGM70205.1 hypothetical protein GCM10009017_20500 [Halarchaeum rubridurum]